MAAKKTPKPEPETRTYGFTDEQLELARRLALAQIGDDVIAYALKMDIGELAVAAWNCEHVFNAITPTVAEIDEYRKPFDLAREKRNAVKRKRLANSAHLRIENSMRARMWAAIKGKFLSNGKLFSRLDYSTEDLANHLESRFKDGMTWKNYGKWHIDHERPCSSFDMTNEDEFKQCWSLSNLQPLWASENILKGSKYAST